MNRDDRAADVTELNVGDLIDVEFSSRFGPQTYRFQLGSVRSFWQEDGHLTDIQVEEKVARSRAREERFYFATALAVVIDARPQVAQLHAAPVPLGAVIALDGHRFVVAEAHNRNIELVELEDEPEEGA